MYTYIKPYILPWTKVAPGLLKRKYRFQALATPLCSQFSFAGRRVPEPREEMWASNRCFVLDYGVVKESDLHIEACLGKYTSVDDSTCCFDSVVFPEDFRVFLTRICSNQWGTGRCTPAIVQASQQRHFNYLRNAKRIIRTIKNRILSPHGQISAKQ